MIDSPFSLRISHLHNWVQYQNRVFVLVQSEYKSVIFKKLVEGKIYNGSLFLQADIPIDKEQEVKVSFNMSTGAYLGHALINIPGLKNIKRSNSNVIEVQLINHHKKLQESQFSFKSNSQSNLRKRGFSTSRSDLKQKYRDKESQLVHSISQYHQSVDKMTSLGKQLSNIRKEMKSKSRSKAKLVSLKEAISEGNLKFAETVYPYVSGKRSKKTTPESSNSTDRILFKHHTASTIADDDYGMFTSRHSHRGNKNSK